MKWIVLSKLLLLVVLLYAGIGLMPDEAQYWTWSKALSYGYYSKPPGIAWQIALGCYLFGDTEFGVRFVSFVLSCALSYAIYWLAVQAGLERARALLCAVAFSLSPLGFFSGFFATTDCPYVLFWTLACAIFLKQPVSYPMLGFAIGLGALWKWPVYAVWIGIAAFSWNNKKDFLRGLFVSLWGLIPSLIWNLQNDFVTFQHVGASIDNVGSKANPLEFLGAQAVLVSPLLFLILIWTLVRNSCNTKAERFCRVCSLLFLLVLFIASCLEKVQGNWAVAAYPTAFVIMALYGSTKWIRAGMALSCLMLAALFLSPLPYRLNPFKQGLGWEHLNEALLSSGYNPKNNFLFSDRYQAASILSFYGPEQKRAYFFNIQELRHNQFDFWPSMAQECLGREGYFVEFVSAKEAENAARRFKEKLEFYFESVQALPLKPLFNEDKVALILRCINYNGKLPTSSNKY